MSKEVGDAICKLVDEGYQIDFGPHVNLTGYYCAIYKSEDYEPCPECDREGPTDWEDSGHGHTLLDAITNAQELSEGTGIRITIAAFE